MNKIRFTLLTTLFLTAPLALFASSSENCDRKPDQIRELGNLQQSICRQFSQLKDFDCDDIEPAAYYKDQNNEMVDATGDGDIEVAKAMAIVVSKNGYSQGVQVCPGVYLATAHGVLDDPRDNKVIREPKDMIYAISPYPLSRDTVMNASSNNQFISPRLRDESNWNKPETDYVFIKADNPLRPDDFIAPAAFGIDNFADHEVSLYRPKTRYNTDSNGVPDFDRKTWVDNFEDLKRVYDVPQKVVQSCITRVEKNESTPFISSSCPTEDSVSGSPYVTTNSNGKKVLVGLDTTGLDKQTESFEKDTLIPNAFLQSDYFCKDYEEACGIPCETLK